MAEQRPKDGAPHTPGVVPDVIEGRDRMTHSADMPSNPDDRFVDLIFETIPHGIFTVTSDRRISSFNKTAEAVTGWKASEVMGMRCSDVFQSSHCAHDCFLKRSMDGNEAYQDEEVTIVRRDGREMQVAVSTAALKDRDGELHGGVEMFRDLKRVVTLRNQLTSTYHCDNIISKSKAMERVFQLLPLLAKSSSSVLIEGEPGTGKELVARAIHNLGERRDGPFVGVNCGALPEALIESELFGHVRGAFTGAKSDRIGYFEKASGGTILLDEIGDVSAAVQVKLLRVLQEREFTRVGESVLIKADVRVIAATNRDLSKDILTGRFRRDLFYRLNVVTVSLPPLRERMEDIPLLVEHFIKQFNAIQGRNIRGLTREAMSVLMSHTFPGNVRELENIVEHGFVVCNRTAIDVEDLPAEIRKGGIVIRRPSTPTPAPPEIPRPLATPHRSSLPPLERAEADAIYEAIKRFRGNRTEAAQLLGISRSTLWRKMKRYEIDPTGW